RIVERLHEDARHAVDDQRAAAVLGVDQRRAAARRMARKIQRANEFWRALDEDQRLFLIPGVVAERHRVGASVEEFLVDRLGNAEAAGRILAVDDDEIEPPVLDERRQVFVDRGASGFADDIADEENTQSFSSGNRTYPS